MKRIVLILFVFDLVFVTPLLHAQERTIENVKNEVYSFFISDSIVSSRGFSAASYRENIQVTDIKRGYTTYLYVANMPDSGWAIVSNEQRYPAIIGYSTMSHFDTNPNNQPGALKTLLEHHMNMIDSLRESPSTFYDRVSFHSPILHTFEDPQRTTDSILLKRNGLINSWDQEDNNDYPSSNCDKVYNKFCPTYFNVNCGRTLAGCSAVAIAQLLWYWRWPDYAMINDTIDAAGVLYGDLRRHYYDWDNMPTSLYNTTTMYQVNMVAGLLRDCGYAANMVYSLAGSAAGPTKIHNALENTYHFHVNRTLENAWTNIAPILQSELQAKRPVICQAMNSLGKIHSFVIDGYSEKTYKYHINFGWGGLYNYSMWDLGFNGYTTTRTFFTELYPDCTTREASVSGLDINIVTSDNDVTLYSANNVSLSQLIVASGGHLNVSAGNKIILNSGFVAQQGSIMKLSTDYHCTESYAPVSMPMRRIVNTEKLEQDQLIVTPNPASNIVSIYSDIPIEGIFLFDINGQKILETDQMQIDIGHLPKGLYIMRVVTANGIILQSKILHN